MNWDLPQEAKQALELLGKWRPMDVEDSLELLSSQFTNPTVRRYAVARLQQADDEVRSGKFMRSVHLCGWFLESIKSLRKMNKTVNQFRLTNSVEY